ncbi:hypothetical protein KCU62_g314, partial [Aureobasidium sp. EXF-3399]
MKLLRPSLPESCVRPNEKKRQRVRPLRDAQRQTAQSHASCRVQPPMPCLGPQWKTGLARAGTGLTLSLSCSHERLGARRGRVWYGRSWRRKCFGGVGGSVELRRIRDMDGASLGRYPSCISPSERSESSSSSSEKSACLDDSAFSVSECLVKMRDGGGWSLARSVQIVDGKKVKVSLRRCKRKCAATTITVVGYTRGPRSLNTERVAEWERIGRNYTASSLEPWQRDRKALHTSYSLSTLMNMLAAGSTLVSKLGHCFNEQRACASNGTRFRPSNAMAVQKLEV